MAIGTLRFGAAYWLRPPTGLCAGGKQTVGYMQGVVNRLRPHPPPATHPPPKSTTFVEPLAVGCVNGALAQMVHCASVLLPLL